MHHWRQAPDSGFLLNVYKELIVKKYQHFSNLKNIKLYTKTMFKIYNRTFWYI